MSNDPRERAEQRTVLMPRRDLGTELPPLHMLQEFVVDSVLAIGAYSVVYRARDTRLQRTVVLKEFMPTALAQRRPDGQVLARLPRFAELYAKGLQSFIAEARMLGGFDHPAVVKVYRFWAENGTAYMVMPYYDGVTLDRWLKDLGRPPSEGWLRKLAGQLMDALAVLHESHCFHRDVAPDNIMMLVDRKAPAGQDPAERSPRPLLLDFGAARRVIGDATQNFTAILKSGYSPMEQYEGEVSLRQGAWTDVYALCAVLYKAAFGKTPPSSVARVVRDDMVAARWAGQGRYSDVFLAAIDAGLAVLPKQRPQSMAALGELFRATEVPPLPPAPPGMAAAVATPAQVDISLEPDPDPAAAGPRWLLPAAVVVGALLLAAIAVLILRR